MWKLFSISILCAVHLIESYKILAVFPFPGKSHGILGEGYVRILLEAGHEVTYITPFPTKHGNPRLKQIDVSKNFETLPSNLLDIHSLMKKEVDLSNLKGFLGSMYNVTRGTLINENVRKFMLDKTNEFDLVIVEWMFCESLVGFSALFNVPYIWSSSLDPHWQVLQLIDEKSNPAYSTDLSSFNVVPLNFKERIQELYTQVHSTLTINLFFESTQKGLYKDYFGPALAARGRELPPLDDVRYNASLMLGNSHVSLGDTLRLPQSYKPIAGYHINPKLKPLPEELKVIMDNAKNGVIYFSMGSNLKSKDLPKDMRNELLNVFGNLKETVLWKFEEDINNLPKNVKLLKWAPQPSILAHPNCKVFITHGGLLSTTETVHYGVPIIGIPVFADQFLNVNRAVRKGFALRVDLTYDLANDLKVAIDEMVSNAKYRNRVKELSFIYHDRPVTPAQELNHWVNHVIKTGGAPHLRSPALMMPWYQKMYLDLVLCIISLLTLIYLLIAKIMFISKPLKKSKTN